MNKPLGGVDIFEGGYTCFKDGKIWSNITQRFVGTVRKEGYIRVFIWGKGYYAHRLIAHAFLGLDLNSELVVDHINGIRHDNRVENIRIITRELNTALGQIRKRTTSDSVLPILSRTRSWQKAALELGFRSNAELKYYCENILKIDPDSLSKLAGISTKNRANAELVRKTYTAEQLRALIVDIGSKASAKKLGISTSTMYNIIREKS